MASVGDPLRCAVMNATRARLPLSLLISSLSLFGCDEHEAPPAGTAADGAAAPGTAQKVDSAAKPGSQESARADADSPRPKTSDGKGSTGAECLAGKWRYTFADDALETMIENLPEGKVTKKEGEIVCDISLSGNKGDMTCTVTGGKPVVIEIAANQTGMPLTINIKMSGKTTSAKFKLADEKTMEFTSEGLGDLKMEVEAAIAGNKIPFPTAPLLEAFGGEMGATNSYECKGDELRLRPQIDAQTSWQKLTRVK